MTFTVLNLFFGLIVDAIQSVTADQKGPNDQISKIEGRLEQIENTLQKIAQRLEG
jgi:archaellum component FlaC